jgi:hypothetical protein
VLFFGASLEEARANEEVAAQAGPKLRSAMPAILPAARLKEAGTISRHRTNLSAFVSASALLLAGLLPQPLASARPDGDAHSGTADLNSSGYTGSTACSQCHADIYREYLKTAMGRSIALADSGLFPGLSLPAHFTNSAIGRHFDLFVRDGKLYQSEYADASDSTEIFRDTRPIKWMIGAGINGYGPVVEQDHYLFQAPLSFYTKPGTWGPSPGYESTDLGFNRPILTGCIFCHSGRVNPVPETNGKYADPPFSETSIGCENCHGPGAVHIQAMKSEVGAGKNLRIVNPARLSPYLADNICMACHQTGDVRVLKPGKAYSDIRPGRPLDDVLSIFTVPPTRESPPNADHVEHYYSMTLSKCYRSSQGCMSCLSCHDPHVEPTVAEAPAYYARKCLTCHTNRSCKIALQTRQRQSPPNNCAGCHMAKRDIQVISHSSATNHRILATPDEPFPDVTYHQITPALPDLIHLNPAPGQEAAAPPSLTLLQAYGELAADHPQYVDRYLDVLTTLEKSMPNNALVEAAVGRRELKSGNFASASTHLLHAVELVPPRATTCADLADALAHMGHTEEAIKWLDKSIELDPFNPFTQRSLVVQLINLKQYARAREALEHYVQVFPQDTFMRQMLTKARAQPVQ